MNVAQTVSKMTKEEKILAMEEIWDDLCHTVGGFESPGWHEDVLRDRQKNLEIGEDRFVDWPTAKRNIQNELP